MRPLSTLRARALVLAALPLLTACSGKDDEAAASDTGADTGSGTTSAAVVWDELRLESSVTLTGGFPSGTGFYATGDDGEIYLRAEGAWSSLGLGLGEDLNDIWGINQGGTLQMLVVGDGGTALRYAGEWTVDASLGTANMEAVDGTSLENLVAVGWGGAYSATPSGWDFQALTGNPRFNDVWNDGVDAVAVGEEGVIAVRGSDGWSLDAPLGLVQLTGVSGTSASDLWVVGDDGFTAHFDGSTWTEQPAPTEAALWSVTALATDQVYVVGNNGFAARWNGSAWTELPTGVDNNLYSVAASSDGVVWACGNRGMALRLQGGN
jgi:hypothetical protein